MKSRKRQPSPQSLATIPATRQARELSVPVDHFPTLIASAGASAQFAYDEFLFGKIRNEHTRVAYERAIRRFLAWCADRKLPLQQVAPKDVGQYLDQHGGSTATKSKRPIEPF